MKTYIDKKNCMMFNKQCDISYTTLNPLYRGHIDEINLNYVSPISSDSDSESDEEYISFIDDKFFNELDDILDDCVKKYIEIEIDVPTKQIQKRYNKMVEICCLCGTYKNNHYKSHHFFPCLDKYRCRECNYFFYQHNHSKNPCFNPYSRIKWNHK